jgi:hypothetical protein
VGTSLRTMLTCKEVSHVLASEEPVSPGWRQRLSVKLHLLMCRHCRRYSRQIQAVGDAARQIFTDSTEDQTSRERLRNSILDQIPRSEKNPSDPQL